MSYDGRDDERTLCVAHTGTDYLDEDADETIPDGNSLAFVVADTDSVSFINDGKHLGQLYDETLEMEQQRPRQEIPGKRRHIVSPIE